jgi:hypothetical protein
MGDWRYSSALFLTSTLYTLFALPPGKATKIAFENEAERVSGSVWTLRK